MAFLVDVVTGVASTRRIGWLSDSGVSLAGPFLLPRGISIMRRFASTVALLAFFSQASSAPAAEKPLVVNVWPGKVPGDVGISGEEKFIELKVDGKPYEVAGKPTKWLTNVSKPTLTLFHAPKDKDTGVAMLICPGGGYHNLGWDVEGEEVAAWLNSIGVTGVILKYRCPRRPGDVKGEPPLGPLMDAQRAVSLVRGNAKEWGINPKKIGMVGFSAGGHLVGATATNFDKRTYDPIDDYDKLSCRPDFAVMLYSGYLKLKEKDELASDLRVSAQTPPILLVHASDDKISSVEHSVTMYIALERAKVPSELHIFASGGHGFGVRKSDQPCSTWTDRCVDWLRNQGFLQASAGR
jgi:acetyl esterase/lipase